MDKPIRMGRSSEPKVHRAYRTGTNNFFAFCRTPPKIQTEPQGSFASGDGPRATSNFYSEQLIASYYALWILRAVRSRLAE
jgi:hypothetical protein